MTKEPEKHFPAWTPLPSTEYTCLSPLVALARPCFLFLSVNLIDSAYSLSEAKGKWVLSFSSSIRGAPSGSSHPLPVMKLSKTPECWLQTPSVQLGKLLKIPLGVPFSALLHPKKPSLAPLL